MSRWAILRVGNHKKWGLRVDWVPSEFGFEPRGPRYGLFLVLGRFTQTRAIWGIFGHFWAASRTYRGVTGQQRALCHGAIKAHMKCGNRFPSSGCFELVPGLFCAKKGWFRAPNALFWEGTFILGQICCHRLLPCPSPWDIFLTDSTGGHMLWVILPLLFALCLALHVCTLVVWLFTTIAMSLSCFIMFQHIDKICLEFVAIAKGLGHNKEDIYKAHNVTHINSPVKYGGLRLRQIYRACRIRYVTLVQGLPRKPTGRLSRLVAQPIERMMTPVPARREHHTRSSPAQKTPHFCKSH